jgi:bifunctional damage-control phosphatase, subfamily II, fusion protein
MAHAAAADASTAFISLAQGTIKDLDGVTAFAIDIGGSLAKLAYYAVHSETHTTFRPDPPSPHQSDSPALYSAEPAAQEVGRLHFAVFETKHIGMCLDFIKAHVRALSTDPTAAPVKYHVNATGGGAHKYAQLFHDKLGVK